ncbi:MAG: Na+/H+ antiporter subunit E [Eubacteriales bacterium]
MRIQKALKYLATILVFAGIYCILREQISWIIFLSGCGVAVAALWLTDRFLIRDTYIHQFTLKPFRFIGYFLFLLIKILKNGIHAARLTLFGASDYTFFSFSTDLTDDFKLNLLANSITLTPGTVTVDRDSQKLLIVQLIRQNEEADLTDIEQFEKLLKKM